MANDPETPDDNSREEAVSQLYSFVAQEMKQGSDQATIARKLTEQGVSSSDAEELVGTIYRQIVTAVKQEALSAQSITLAGLGGVIAAAVGGGVWAAIVVLTDYEVGIVAWGIGALCGFAVALLAGGGRGLPLQVIAAVTGVLGIAMGKYLTFFHFLKANVVSEYGAEVAAELSVLSTEVMLLFRDNASALLSGFDLLWVALAVITAWRIPQGSGITLPRSAGPT